MTDNLFLALQITAFGMGLVFAAIILLWLIMILLTFITTERESASRPAETVPTANGDLDAQAAAIAVAMALAEAQTSTVRALSTPPSAIVSAWQLGMRTRQLYQKGMPLVRKTRRAG